MVSTHLKNICQNGSFPQAGVKIKNVSNHHLENRCQRPRSPGKSVRGSIRSKEWQCINERSIESNMWLLLIIYVFIISECQEQQNISQNIRNSLDCLLVSSLSTLGGAKIVPCQQTWNDFGQQGCRTLPPSQPKAKMAIIAQTHRISLGPMHIYHNKHPLKIGKQIPVNPRSLMGNNKNIDSPEKLTYPPENDSWKRIFLFKWSLFRWHVHFRGGINKTIPPNKIPQRFRAQTRPVQNLKASTCSRGRGTHW